MISEILSFILESIIYADYYSSCNKNLIFFLWTVIIILLCVFILGILFFIFKSKNANITNNSNNMIGKTGIAITDIDLTGKVLINAEYWNAKSKIKIKKGSKIKILSLSGLIINVEELK